LLYIVLIAGLGYSLASALKRHNVPHLPQAQQTSASPQLGQEPAPAPLSVELPAARKTVPPGAIDEDDALLALNSLSQDDAPGDALDAQRSNVAAPVTPAPSVAAPSSGDEQSSAGVADDDDARSVFSDAQPSEPFGTGDQFIGGGRSSGPPSLLGGGAAAQEPPANAGSWVSGQARGYAMLYAMQPGARAVVESNVATLLAAQIREPYIGVLVDGTFSLDTEYLKTVISRLSVDRNLTLELYLTNGATQRAYDQTPIRAPFVTLAPLVFRSRIQFDEGLKREFSSIAARARDLFEYSKQQNPANQHIASVMLEDNLDVGAYRTMRELAAQQLDGTAGFIRSTCLRCVSPDDRGSDADTAGDPREEHKPDKMRELRRGDGFTLDGTGFRYPGESATLGISPDELKSLVQEGYAKGLRFFGLWRHNWQGAKQFSRDNPHPDERNYVASTPEQEAFELEVLRLGLIAEPSDDNEEADSGILGMSP